MKSLRVYQVPYSTKRDQISILIINNTNLLVKKDGRNILMIFGKIKVDKLKVLER